VRGCCTPGLAKRRLSGNVLQALTDRRPGPCHQVGGYAAPVQGPVEHEVAVRLDTHANDVIIIVCVVLGLWLTGQSIYTIITA